MANVNSLGRIILSLLYVTLIFFVVRAPLKWEAARAEAAPTQAQRTVKQKIEPQGQQKVVEEADSYNPQVRVTKVKTGQEIRQLDEPFEDSDDWIKKFSLELENVSSKPIVYLQVNLNLPETKYSGSMMSFPIDFGLRPGSKLISSNEPIKLMPRDKLTLTVAQQYQRLARFVETRHSLSQLRKLQVEIGFIVFDDTTAWAAGDFLRQDLNNPDHYVNVTANPQQRH